LGVSGPKNTKNCQNFQLFPLPDIDEIRRLYAGNRSTKAINIWCDLVSKLGIYWQKQRWGISPPQKKIFFSESPSPETTGRIEKIKGECKNGTDILYLNAKFGGDPPLHGGVSNKSWVFLIFLFVSFEQRFSHSNSDIVAICRLILMRISAFFRGINARSDI